jgi:hypothetical protein
MTGGHKGRPYAGDGPQASGLRLPAVGAPSWAPGEFAAPTRGRHKGAPYGSRPQPADRAMP